MSEGNKDDNIYYSSERTCYYNFLYNTTVLCEEVNAANNIKLATFIAPWAT